MKTRKFWVPVICSLIVTPLLLLAGIASGGAGHGDYFWATILFSYTMLSALAFKYIHLPFVLLAVAQYPAYGACLGFANERGRFARAAMILLLAHSVRVAAVLIFADEGFS